MNLKYIYLAKCTFCVYQPGEMAENVDKKSISRLSIGQMKAARALLGMTQAELAAAADVACGTIKNYERGLARPRPQSMRKISDALIAAGARPIAADEWGGEGVRLYK